jgi:hypothetical protein
VIRSLWRCIAKRLTGNFNFYSLNSLKSYVSKIIIPSANKVFVVISQVVVCLYFLLIVQASSNPQLTTYFCIFTQSGSWSNCTLSRNVILKPLSSHWVWTKIQDNGPLINANLHTEENTTRSITCALRMLCDLPAGNCQSLNTVSWIFPCFQMRT